MLGIPVCFTTDMGTETHNIFARQKALREMFAPHLDEDEVPAFIYLKSTDNIVIERSWRPAFTKVAENILIHWNDGVGRTIFDGNVWVHRYFILL